MRIVDAIWEQRNFGFNVTEVVCSEHDSAEELSDALKSIEAPYSVVIVPAGCTQLLMCAQRSNYQFIETSFHYEASLNRIIFPGVFTRFMNQLSVLPASEQLKEKALDEIRSGALFSTDRIALDPVFSKELAGKRYYNWCVDALDAGADMEIAFLKDEPVAFNISQKDKNREGVVNGLIGGMYSESINKGLGFLLVQCEMECCRKLGGRICAGTTSSNNMQSLRLHMHFGFDITGSDYVLIRHK